MLRTIQATRYLKPLREGGSLPAIVEADDGQLYVMKFVGAGQGAKALIAELVAGEIARLLGLRVPEIALIELDAAFGRNEPNPEIRDLLQASIGLNLAMRYLPNAMTFNAMVSPFPEANLASMIVWFDAYITNVDRTPRNVNLLIWQDNLWLIDHGAALYFHHDWKNYLIRSESPFAPIKDHTLLAFADALPQADITLRARLNSEVISPIIDLIPDSWLGQEACFASQAEHRSANEPGLIVTFEQLPEQYYQDAASFGWDFRRLEKEGKLKIIMTTPEVGQLDVEGMEGMIERAADQLGVRRVVVDSISHFMRLTTDQAELRWLEFTFINSLKRFNLTTILTRENHMLLGESIPNSSIGFVADSYIVLRYVEIESMIRKALFVLKMRGSNHDKDIRQYDITSQGIEVQSKFEGREGILSGSPRRLAESFVQAFVKK